MVASSTSRARTAASTSGYGTSFNPASDAGNVGTALSASDTAANSVNLEPEKTRNFEVGTKWSVLRGAPRAHRRGVPHREDQRAHAQPRERPVCACRTAACEGYRGRRVGPARRYLDGVCLLRLHGQRDRRFGQPYRGGPRPRADAREHRQSVDQRERHAETERRRRRAVHGRRVSQHDDGPARAELLALERDRRVRAELAPHVARQRRTILATSTTWTA